MGVAIAFRGDRGLEPLVLSAGYLHLVAIAFRGDRGLEQPGGSLSLGGDEVAIAFRGNRALEQL